MSTTKGFKLYVRLGAAQTRRRLKGFGHGVRKVQSAGRNQAVIIHTATGAHRTELEAKFADVGFATTAAALEAPQPAALDFIVPAERTLASNIE